MTPGEQSILSKTSLVNVTQSHRGIPVTNYSDICSKAKRPATSKIQPTYYHRNKKIEVQTKRVFSRDDQKSARSYALSSTLIPSSDNKIASERPLSVKIDQQDVD